MLTYQQLLDRCVEDEEGCLLWQGAPSKKRPQLVLKGVRHPISRYVWIITYGYPPEELEVCHHCDKPRCIRLSCLWLGTHGENMADRRKKRPGYRRGMNPVNQENLRRIWKQRTKLSPEHGPLIRRLYEEGLTQQQLANKFGISKCSIGRIVRNEALNYRD